MVNATALVNFGNGTGLEIGDWTYSTYLRSAPNYLPLNDSSISYLASSYPTLFTLLPAIYKVTPVNVAGTLPGSGQWGGALSAYGAGVYVAVGNGPCYSTDGITWIASTIPGTPRGIAYGAGVFAAHGNGTGSASSSTNGTTWTARTAISSLSCVNMIYANGVFVAVGSDTSGLAATVSATSTDGITWTARTIPSNIYGSVGQQALAYGAGLFVAFPSSAGTQTSYATSPDGITWTNRSSPTSGYIKTVAFGNGIFIGMCNGFAYYTSTDGINWSTVNTSLPNYGNVSNIAFGDGVFVVTVLGGSTALITTDGVTWKTTTLACTSPSSLPFCIAYGPSGSGTFVVLNSSSAGTGGTAPTTASKLTAAISTTSFTLPVVTPVTGTYTYIRAT